MALFLGDPVSGCRREEEVSGISLTCGVEVASSREDLSSNRLPCRSVCSEEGVNLDGGGLGGGPGL